MLPQCKDLLLFEQVVAHSSPTIQAGNRCPRMAAKSHPYGVIVAPIHGNFDPVGGRVETWIRADCELWIRLLDLREGSGNVAFRDIQQQCPGDEGCSLRGMRQL